MHRAREIEKFDVEVDSKSRFQLKSVCYFDVSLTRQGLVLDWILTNQSTLVCSNILPTGDMVHYGNTHPEVEAAHRV